MVGALKTAWGLREGLRTSTTPELFAAFREDKHRRLKNIR